MRRLVTWLKGVCADLLFSTQKRNVIERREKTQRLLKKTAEIRSASKAKPTSDTADCDRSSCDNCDCVQCRTVLRNRHWLN